jgi:cephalosporin-C deacetylase-like acetyl esterase
MPVIHPHYPAASEVDEWCNDVAARARARLKSVHLGDGVADFRPCVRHTPGRYVTFECSDGRKFHGFWQTAPSGKGPVLLHVPGYGAEMSAHPELVSRGWNVLHINPPGYATPGGFDESKRPGGTWPVLPDTVSSLGRKGYADWLADAAAATFWALEQDCVEADRFAFFGTSQGGGTALLLASIFSPMGVRCVAADVPFLTNFALMYGKPARGAYEVAFAPLAKIEKERPGDVPAAWRAIGFIDTMSHAHRLGMPVLLTAAAEDATCPPPTIRSLFDTLPGTRSYTEIAKQGHAYTMHFLHLAEAWFRLFV